MSYPFETQPSKFALCRGLARYLKEKGDARAYELEQLGKDELRAELPWWVRIFTDALDWCERAWRFTFTKVSLDTFATLSGIGFIVASLEAAFRNPLMVLGAIYFAVLYAMIRLDQIRDNKPVYITPMDDEEENGEVQS